jgi:hypothetical protein
MSNNLESLLAYLNQQADLIDAIYKKSIIPRKSSQRLILENGLPFVRRIKPSPFKGEPKSCYQNCTSVLWKYPQLSYCEGFAISNEVSIPIAHAWLVDDKSQVADPTWSETLTNCAYFGVVFTKEFVSEVVLKTKHYGILDDYYVNKYQILLAGFPKGSLHSRFHFNI